MINEILKPGKENLLTTAEIMKALKLDSSREVTALVNKERTEGAVILSVCSGSGGYYLPAEDQEQRKQDLKDFICMMNSRRDNIDRSTISARKELAALTRSTEEAQKKE